MKRSNTRKASVIGLLLVVMVFSTVFGIMSARRQNWAYRIYLQLYWKKQRLFSEEDKARATPGIWLPARNQTLVISEERQKAVDNLTALPYLKGYNQAPEVQNVTVHNEELAYRGINFVLSSNAPNAFLMDMQGNILHKWQKDFKEVWPELENAGKSKFAQYWKRARMLKNGDLLAIFTDLGLIKLDKNSNLLWAFQKRCHHDMFENDDGNIYVLTRSVKKQPELQLESYDTERPLMLDYVTILSPEGKEVRSISLLDCFLNSNFAPMLEHMKMPLDVLHTNTIRPIDGKLEASYPMFKKGHLLISLRDIHTIAVVDPEQEKITWAITGMWKYQHEPRLLKNGNIMLFDNRGFHGKSRIVEIDPLTLDMVWSYYGEPPETFFSERAGTNERLPNGHTLITESEGGRAFEVTPEGKIVWEFYNPNRAGEKNELIASLYDVIRIDREEVAWLSQD